MKRSKKRTPKEIDPLARDLSELLEKGNWFKVRFELEPKSKSITMRLSEKLLEAIKARAETKGIDYQKWIREALEEALAKGA